MAKKKGTKTSKFGVSKRESHDSEPFYNRRLYSSQPKSRERRQINDKGIVLITHENLIPEDIIDDVHYLDSRNMDLLPNDSVHLVVTSPPYNAAKEYDEDLTLEEYTTLLKDVFQEAYNKLVDGGRLCINITNVGRSPYIPCH